MISDIQLTDIVKKELKKIEVPGTAHIKTERYGETDLIDIEIMSQPDTLSGARTLFVALAYDQEKRRMNYVSLHIPKYLRGRGIGKQLAILGENIGKKLSCEEILLCNNVNTEFWAHIGYRKTKRIWKKELDT